MVKVINYKYFHVHATLACALDNGEPNIARHAPCGAPWVLDGDIISSVADSQDTMIKGGPAVGIVVNTGGVGLESCAGSVNCDRDGLLSNRVQHLVGVVSRDIGVACWLPLIFLNTFIYFYIYF